MEDLIRVLNEYDRQVLVWLRGRVGDAAIRDAVWQLEGDGKPYLSAVCKVLQLRPPTRQVLRHQARHTNRAVGDRYLADIRRVLSRPPRASGWTQAELRLG
jgi:hypothetical protein